MAKTTKEGMNPRYEWPGNWLNGLVMRVQQSAWFYSKSAAKCGQVRPSLPYFSFFEEQKNG